MKIALQKMDKDDNGLSREELLMYLDYMAKIKQGQENKSDEIDYTMFPEKVQKVMRTWDGDASGSVSVGELALAAEAQKKMEDQNRQMKLIILLLVIVVMVLVIMGFLTSLRANEQTKDFQPEDEEEED